jgi:alpha,alpha-trehalose-phosphate synthase [UDP-forming]
MHFFRLRLILALVACVTLVSVGFTYFEVLAHKHFLRADLEKRTAWLCVSLQPDFEQKLAWGYTAPLTDIVSRARTRTGVMAIALYDEQGELIAASGPSAVLKALAHAPVEKALHRGANIAAFDHEGETQWLQDVVPLHHGDQLQGALAVVTDAGYIRTQANSVWQRSFLRTLTMVVLITLVTLVMVRWLLLQPILRVTERLRKLRIGQHEDALADGGNEFSLFKPLTREVESMAESLIAARAAAQAEARLRDAAESQWTAERLAVHMAEKNGSSRIFVVSNREPYIHVRHGREIACSVPPSGLVTAIEPILRACDGVWVASGSGNADSATVDEHDHIRVPPDDPRYTLRRVWLSAEEEANYYEGFSNEGLWPLCHIAHTRPIFRASDWECYKSVNERFAQALLEEMKGCEDPIVFVQDYHFALLPRMVKEARPDARVAIFWHIPWPNPEAFGICPWQSELLDGLLGADLIGFHVPMFCSNFLATVDRALEARTDREHTTVRRRGHVSLVRPYPISVAFDGTPAPGSPASLSYDDRNTLRNELLKEFGVRADIIVLGVDRLDYTKGIVERLLAIEELLDKNPRYREHLTMVQIAAPSRTRIPSYAALRQRVEEAVERINQRFQTAHWRPIVLIERQCNHEEVNRWYRASDVCLVTSLHDGMNLVAKEFVAARDDEDGVLVLSKFTGAAVELRDALLVNPYDTVGVAAAIQTGLEMDREKRRLRMWQMRRQVMEYNIYRWAARVMGDLREVRIENVVAPGVAGPAATSAPQKAGRKLAS